MDKISTQGEILEGLKMALNRGESLARAKLTFINAGYNKEDIETVAGFLDAPKPGQAKPAQPETKPGTPPTEPIVSKPTQSVSNYGQTSQGSPAQSGPLVKPKEVKSPLKVSDYKQPESKSGRKMIIISIILILVFVGALIVTLLFKEKLIEFFGGLF
ncbi:hypothetical protein GOV13_05480 [Candidatus Pacearchaeota archaeon]|nr:hypothetical protein [Candidatus Pacearchaeota archaeon]